MTETRADLLVIGGGSGGIAVAVRAARHGARVIVFEPRELGGTCVNRGCVPKKAMWLAAELAEAQRFAANVGFDVVPGKLDWAAFVARRDAYVARARASYDKRFEELGIRLVRAAARFVNAHTLRADGIDYHAPHIVIAAGGRPRGLDIPGGGLAIDSDGFFALDACPARVAVIGGGYIGVELAGVLAALGAEVDLLARGSLLSHFDADLGTELAQAMRRRGIRVHLDCRARGIEDTRDGYVVDCGDGVRRGPCDVVINATGRVPDVAALDLHAAGIEPADDGHVPTDAQENTRVEGVYAIGDVNGKLALTPVAVAAGRQLADRLFGGRPDARLDYDAVPTVVFAHPPVGSVGLSGREARARYGDAVQIRRVAFTPMLWSLAGEEGRMHLKLVCVGPEQRIVGLHGIGPGMDEILQGFAVAVKMGACHDDFLRTVAIHPTAAEEFVTIG